MNDHCPHRAAESGSALVFALMFTTLVLGIVTTGTLSLQSQSSQNRTLFVTNYQAVMAARSGLTEALSWMRRQTAQPVLTFAPQRDAMANPPVLDTENPDIGLVRDFNISGNLWARYEVWREWDDDPDPERLAWRQQFQCEDVSAPRVGGAPGAAWRLRSIGYIYRRIDRNVPFNVRPNVVLATEEADTDVIRLVINLPGTAAINVGNGGASEVGNRARVNGNGLAGFYFPQSSGTPSNSGSITGLPALSASSTYDDSYAAVFNLTPEELTAMADFVVSEASEFPSPLPAGAIVVANTGGPLELGPGRPLLGSGLVVVRGDCTLALGNGSLFSGLLYVEGDLTIRAPSELNGSIICTGAVSIVGSTDFATVNYDGDVIHDVLDSLGSYRRANSLSLPRRER